MGRIAKTAIICRKDPYTKCEHLSANNGVLLLSFDAPYSERKKYKNSTLSISSEGSAKIAVCELLTVFEENAVYAYRDSDTKMPWGKRLFSEKNYNQTNIVDVKGNFKTFIKYTNIALIILEGEIKNLDYSLKHNYFKRKRGAFRR